MPMATRLLASDPAHWPYAPVYDLLSLSLTPRFGAAFWPAHRRGASLVS